MKIANIDRESFHERLEESSERLEEFQWNFQGDATYDNIKSHKKAGLHPLFRRYSFEKATGDSIEPSPPVFLGLKENKSLKTSNNLRKIYMLGVNNISPEEGMKCVHK